MRVHRLSVKDFQSVGNNVPDLWVGGKMRSMWIEVKWFENPIPADSIPYRTRNYFTAGQEAWLRSVCVESNQPFGSALLTGTPAENILVWGPGLAALRYEPWSRTRALSPRLGTGGEAHTLSLFAQRLAGFLNTEFIGA